MIDMKSRTIRFLQGFASLAFFRLKKIEEMRFILQIRDRRKQKADESHSNPTLIQSITAHAQSLYDNLFSVQDLNQNALLNYAGLWFDGKIDVVDFELRNEKPDKISLSWHLTKKEKKKVMESIHLPENQLAFKRLKVLLEE